MNYLFLLCILPLLIIIIDCSIQDNLHGKKVKILDGPYYEVRAKVISHANILNLWHLRLKVNAGVDIKLWRWQIDPE